MECTDRQVENYKKKLHDTIDRLKSVDVHLEVIFRSKDKVEVRFYTYKNTSCVHNRADSSLSLHIVPCIDIKDAVFLAGQALHIDRELKYRVSANKCKFNTYFSVYGEEHDRKVVLKSSFLFDIIKIKEKPSLPNRFSPNDYS